MVDKRIADDFFDAFWDLSENLEIAWEDWGAIDTGPLAEDPPRESLECAWFLAMAVGRCLLFNYRPPSAPTALSLAPRAAYAGLRSAQHRTVKLAEQLEERCDRLLSMDTAIEQHDAVTAILTERLDLQAAGLAFTRAVAAAPPELTQSPFFLRQRLDIWHDSLSWLDQRMDENREPLSLVVETYWAQNTAPVIADSGAWPQLPWWLTEEAESVYDQWQDVVKQLEDAGRASTIDLELGLFEWRTVQRTQQEQDSRRAEHRVAAAGTEDREKLKLMVRWQGGGRREAVAVELRLPEPFSNQDPAFLPQQLEAKLTLAIKFSGTPSLPEVSRWRLRLGRVVKEFRVKDIVDGRRTGECTISGRELGRVVESNGFEAASVRRIA